ncbi:MAG: FAD-dependent oxidoreductase [Saccharospirillum sp.]|uniref:NAD(P)/FAD-dependent oxidoreductase n=1 Tax=Saccharospirillum sp. TaxID=2033801 RepID=UPI003299FFAE
MAVFAVVGAGLSGMTLARELEQAGHRCQVFEKSRGRGGRLATRRRDGWQADHGAQYFTVRDPAFQQEVDRWLAEGWVAPWPVSPVVLDGDGVQSSPDEQTRYVGTPTMNAMVQGLSEGLDLFVQTRVDRLERVGKQWRLWDDQGEQYGQFDAVLLTAPLAQSLALLPPGSNLEVPLRGTTAMLPCWALAITFSEPTGIEADAAFVKTGVVNWLARDSSKPGRAAEPETWVAHFTAQWSANHLDASDSLLEQQCLAALRRLGQPELPAVSDRFKHRWLYARSGTETRLDAAFDTNLAIGLAGDWTQGDRLEGAWRSGHRLAKTLIEQWA